MQLLSKIVKEGEADVEYAVMRDKKVVYLDDEGKEDLFDPGVTIPKLKQTVNEREAWKSKHDAIELKLKEWEGLDPTKAKEALDTLTRVEKGQLINADEVKKIQDEAARRTEQEYKDQITAARKGEEDARAKARETGLRALFGELIKAPISKENKDPLYAFGLSTAMGNFARHFEEVDGEWIAYYNPGSKEKNRVLSKATGEPAKPDEAFRLLVENHTDRDYLLAGVAATGSGNAPSGPGGRGATALTRAQFNELPPMKKAEHMAKVRQGQASLVDA